MSEFVTVTRDFLMSLKCPMCDGSGWINDTGPDPQHDGCPWCEARDRFLAGDLPDAVPSPAAVAVPREPTEEMLKAADKALWKQMKADDPGEHNDRPICKAIWRAMLSAAPKQRAPEALEDKVEAGGCCCAIHHPNHGRCLQCPVHGLNPPAPEPHAMKEGENG